MISIAITDVGKIRPENQDSVFNQDTKIGALPNLYIVADGMGGHRAGEVASICAIESFVNNVKNTGVKDILSIMQESIISANAHLIEMSTETKAYEGMGTTMVSVVVDGSTAYIMNVGDSRLYLINEEIKQITRDHSLVQEMVNLGELDEKSAQHAKNKNVITKAVGTETELSADFFDIEIQNDDVLLLCSDGLTNMLENKDIHEILLKNDKIEDAAKELVDLANENGGKDNISVILIKKDISE